MVVGHTERYVTEAVLILVTWLKLRVLLMSAFGSYCCPGSNLAQRCSEWYIDA